MAGSYYGWRIVAALAVTQTLGYGVLYYAFGVLVKPLETELGFTRSQTSGAFSLGLLVAGLAAVPVGHWVDRRGGRALMTAGSLFGALMVFLWAHIHSLAGLYAVWTGMGVAMSATLYEVAFTVVAVWFRTQRARATFAVTMVAGLASSVFVPLTTLLTSALGWRAALDVLALLLVLAAPLHALVLRRSPQALGLTQDGAVTRLQGTDLPAEQSLPTHEALRSADFWWLTLAFGLGRFAFAAMGAHLIPLLLERGYTPATVALIAGSIGPLQLLGRVVFAPALNRWSLEGVTAAMFLSLAVAFASLQLSFNLSGVLVFVLLYGMSNGATTLSRAALIAALYGSANFGSINGVVALVVAVMGAAAPLLAGLLYVQLGGYTALLWTLTSSGVVAAAATFHARRGPDTQPL